ncbi:MAG: response regulator transcription factor [Planctomycetales bacterium]|nr:response regulator transcription factor [Planctomycetales bacterium]
MRILCVEDEPDLLSTLSQTLREDGYAVDTANDGQEGLYKSRVWAYDAIVLDWMLPKLSGIELLKTLRQTSSTPVLLLTAKDEVTDRVQGLDAGADDYLVKPFSLLELLARLRALIRRASGHGDNTICLGEVILDTAAKQVSVAGQCIALTAREYALVELLALKRNRLVSRSEIYDHLFDESDDSLSNLVDVHVSNIRKKLGKDFIETRRGQGYVVHG